MLYIYSFYNKFETKEEEKSILSGCNKLKPFGFDLYYLSESKFVIVNNEKIDSDCTLSEYIHDVFDGGEFFEFEAFLSDGKMEIPITRAIELLSDDLRSDDSQYEERILNANCSSDEINEILKELIVVVFGMIIDEFNDIYKDIEKNGFQWK